MTIHIKNLKVRPRKSTANNMCGPQLAAMLACWAATGDVHSKNKACSEAAAGLFNCMKTSPMPQKSHKPSINYHLGRLGKTIQ
ncbi:hypothetical protein AMATHDRAFT_74164 [Amanita thiersii Skay4041]|uniref:37S ribosomal protein mrp10, mitochondrial n=1 Tax=Amanita thiersii Skay4041 TaxID=703135 RepID=A0A2A9NVQ9_9AGAR|nr:hypothetical protein AMATHDRAFT_74164 [Amanita thiersii Skay4041]